MRREKFVGFADTPENKIFAEVVARRQGEVSLVWSRSSWRSSSPRRSHKDDLSVRFLILGTRAVRTERDDFQLVRPCVSISLHFYLCSPLSFLYVSAFQKSSTINEITACRSTGVIGTRKTMLRTKSTGNRGRRRGVIQTRFPASREPAELSIVENKRP